MYKYCITQKHNLAQPPTQPVWRAAVHRRQYLVAHLNNNQVDEEPDMHTTAGTALTRLKKKEMQSVIASDGRRDY